MDNKRFDDIIKKKLESFKTDSTPNSWDMLSGNFPLDGEIEDTLADQDFDESIRHKLDSLQTEYNPDSWEELAAKIELNELEEEILEDHFDRTIQGKMKAFSLPFSSSSWELLKDRMEKEAFLRSQVYIAKASEIFIICLLLFTVYRLLPINPEKRFSNIEFSQFQINDADQKKLASASDNPENDFLSRKVYDDTAQGEVITQGSRNNKRLTNEIKSYQPLIAATNPSLLTSASKGEEEIIIGLTARKEKETISALPAIAPFIEEVQHPGDFVVYEKNPNLLSSQSGLDLDYISQDKNHILVSGASTLDLIPNNGIDHSTILMHPEIPIIHPEGILKTKLWFNGFISVDAMLVNTPYDPVYDVPAFNKAAAGYSGGFSISAQKGSLELEAGLSYSSKGYQPQLIRELSGSLETNYVERSLTNIVFDMAQINFNIKHHFFKNKKIQLYALAGSTLNLIAYSQYNFEEKPRSGNSETSLTPILTKLLDQKNFEKGAFEGGGLISNSYFTINGGIGLQYNVNKKLALFFQPTYQRHILDSGVGPNNDRIHTLSLQFGTKVLLK